MLRAHFALLFFLPLLSGCYFYHDLTDTPEARETHLIGKKYDLACDLSLGRYKGDRFIELAKYVPVDGNHDLLEGVPRGTTVTVKQIVEEDRITIALYHPLADIEDKAFSHTRVSLIKALGGISFGFGSTFSAVPDYTMLTPHLSHPLRGTTSADLLIDLRDADFAVRYFAARKLGELPAPFPKEVVSGLIAATADGDPEVRLRAIQSLKPALSDDPVLIRALIAALLRRRDERNAAFESLVKIGAPALPYLAPMLDGNDQGEMGEAADVLAEAGAAGKPYLPKLAAAIPRFHSHPSSIVMAMGRIDAVASVDLIVPLTKDRKTREAGIEALCEIHLGSGQQAHAATDRIVAILTDALSDPDENIRAIALLGLDRIGPPAGAALPKLKEMLKVTPENPRMGHIARIEVERAIERIEQSDR